MNNQYYLETQPIVALCTPHGPGALALIRVSGDGAVSVCNSLAHLGGQQSLLAMQSHTIVYGKIYDTTDNCIDTVMFSVMHGPKTFTGQDTVEISCHNNPFIIEKIITSLIASGARHAQAGEFSKRAVLNGKMNILQAEAIVDLINANNDRALKQSLGQVIGSLSAEIIAIERDLLQALSLCQASFEFIEEENQFETTIKDLIRSVITKINGLISSSTIQKQIRTGFRIALLGMVNAGKSSLFNTLIQESKAIVTSIPGTTRDIIEAGIYKEGYYITFIDTAGLRNTDDIIESEGIRRSLEQAKLADIILLVYDITHQLNKTELNFYETLNHDYTDKIIAVGNKSDLSENHDNSKLIYCSTRNRIGIDNLQKEITNKINNLLLDQKTPFLLNKRQNEIIGSVNLEMNMLYTMIEKKNIAYELISYHLEIVLSILSQLTGKTISEASMDKIFRDFCVGK